ncbi:MAG: vWA domain-containing protein [Bdellovibrionales bacterium]
MTQLKRVMEPFGEVNVYPASNNKTRVVATILMEPYKEGAQTGIALDGSGSMRKLYGQSDGSGVVSSIFKKKTLENEIAPVAQQLCSYLARKIDSDGGTTCIYWATGDGGREVEVVGDFAASQAENYAFGPPADFGTGTYLLPAVKYFVDRFRDSPWGFYVFVTDGELFDLNEVKNYSVQLAREIAAGRRNPVKFILIGLGTEVNERQMIELDDLETGTNVDLWDHKLASELRVLEQIFAEVVDKNARVADNGKILDAQGNVIKNYSDTGLPAYLEFEIANGNAYFTLEVEGNRIHQPLFEQAQVPHSQMTSAPNPPPISPSAPAATAPPSQPASPTPPPLPAHEVKEEELIEDASELHTEEDELWKMIDLEKAEDSPEDT